MGPKQVATSHFAPAERAAPEQLRCQAQALSASPQYGQVLDNVPDLLMVLNRQRQVVHANQQLLQLLGVAQTGEILGRRPGEILGCLHASRMPGGCGTSENCRDCGAVLAILASQEGKKDLRECRLLVNRPDKGVEALDLQVWAVPVRVGEEDYSFVAVSDLADQKRRRVLERVFFHDVLNTAGGLAGLASLLLEAEPGELKTLADSITQAAGQLLQEIKAQRDLLAAESRELAVQAQSFPVGEFLRQQAQIMKSHPLGQGRRIALLLPLQEVTLRSDPTLLGRVVVNLLKNALEASGPGDEVGLGLESLPLGGAEILVRNQGTMPPQVQRQVFQRSFSTKGPGRGLGTYSVKLLTETYLKGEVSFTSSQGEGTTFRLRLPDLPAPGGA